jgi:hypothetical protein
VTGRGSAGVRTRAALAMAITVLAGCGAAQVSGEGELVVEHAGFRVPVPDGWYAETANDAAGRFRVVAYLSNQPLDLDCTGAGAARHCSQPVRLADGGLLVWWFAASCAGVDCAPPDGDPLLLGGREASRIAGASVCCDELDAISGETYLVAVSAQRLDAIMVCQRNAPSSARRELANLLEHIDWRTP